MEKDRHHPPYRSYRHALALFLCLFLATSSLFAQNISLNVQNTSIKNILKEIQPQTTYKFVYNDALVGMETVTSLTVKNEPLENVLKKVFEDKGISYEIKDQQIILFPSKQAVTQNTLTVRGTVLDEAGEPLPGAIVAVKGNLKKNATTDINGKFELNEIEPNTTLLVSFLGFETAEYPVNNRNTVNVQLKPSVVRLEEVVVTGYSTKKTGEITGSVQKITAKDLDNTVSSPDISNMLKGRTTGFYVAESADGVRSQSNIIIRGQSTIPGNIGPTAPLVVLDGVIIGNVDMMNLVNSNDIESVTLLKDASSTAIYGSRAALGVIVITTHKGRTNQERISVNANLRSGIVREQNLVALTNTSQWIENTNRYLSKAWDESPNVFQASYPNKDNFMAAKRLYSDEQATQYYDWNKALFDKTGNFSDLNLNFRAGTQKSALYGGAGWYRESGVRLSDKLNRMNFKLNADIEFASWIKAGFYTSVIVNKSSVRNGMPSSGTAYMPFLVPKDKNGDWNETLPYSEYVIGISGPLYSGQIPNPLYENETFDNTSESTKINGVGTFNLKLTPIKGLVIQTSNTIIYNNAYINSNYDSDSYSGKFGSYSQDISTLPTMAGFGDMHGVLNITNSHAATFLTSNTAQYTRSFGLHNLTGLAGQEYSKTSSKSVYNDYYDILPGERNPGAAKYFGNEDSVFWWDPYSPRGSQSESALFSVFGQLDYNYDQRYIATVSVRTDASPSFGKNKRYGTFYSLSGAWQMHREKFMGNVKFLDMLKLRYAYGTSGRDLGGVFLNKTFYSNTSNYNDELNTGSIISQLGNPDIGWETTYNNTLGVDFAFLNRVSGSVDLYHKRSSGLVQTMVLPATQGGFSQQQNIGEIVNKGIEFIIQADIIRTRNFTWNLSANYSYNNNEITKLAKDSLQVGAGQYYKYVGEDINTIKAIVYAGVDPDTGAPLFENFDSNGKKIIVTGFQGGSDIRNFQAIGTTTPKYFGGFQSTWTYKNLSLSTDWYFQAGNIVNNKSILSAISPATVISSGSNLVQIPSSMKIWSGPGDTGANIPDIYSSNSAPTNANGDPGWDFVSSSILGSGASMYGSTGYQSGNQLRLRNIKLSYNLPSLFAQKCYMQNATVYLSIDNVFVIKKKELWSKDPDSALRAINPLRVIVGLNINF